MLLKDVMLHLVICPEQTISAS